MLHYLSTHPTTQTLFVCCFQVGAEQCPEFKEVDPTSPIEIPGSAVEVTLIDTTTCYSLGLALVLVQLGCQQGLLALQVGGGHVLAVRLHLFLPDRGKELK